ncbi:uncharacterized protein VTP21DRAFT_11254 [Calcarisporiella thermophila]|uniref:uncharacterized protein n=1 Tax=Calcarisporiella thermophila TaxID=911321 RepID=UPI003743DBBC
MMKTYLIRTNPDVTETKEYDSRMYHGSRVSFFGCDIRPSPSTTNEFWDAQATGNQFGGRFLPTIDCGEVFNLGPPETMKFVKLALVFAFSFLAVDSAPIEKRGVNVLNTLKAVDAVGGPATSLLEAVGVDSQSFHQCKLIPWIPCKPKSLFQKDQSRCEANHPPATCQLIREREAKEKAAREKAEKEKADKARAEKERIESAPFSQDNFKQALSDKPDQDLSAGGKDARTLLKKFSSKEQADLKELFDEIPSSESQN